MSLATIRESPGLDAYLEDLEERLTAAVQAQPGLVAAVGGEALVAGGKRLRPLLVFLAAPPGEAHAASPVCRATIPPAKSRQRTFSNPAARRSSASSSGPGKRRTLAGRYV